VSDWLDIHRGDAPLVIAFPHGGTDLTGPEDRFVSSWLALKDVDYWIAELYAFARDMGATTIATRIGRAVIDARCDPSGASFYLGMATTALCPIDTFDGEPLYAAVEPDEAEIADRRERWHDPYRAALRAELDRLRDRHGRFVLYDAHSIRSCVPRLFEDELPRFNIGTNGGTTCAPELEAAVVGTCAGSGLSQVVNGRFKDGWTTRRYGRADDGFHANHMELAQRGYMAEPAELDEINWPGTLHDQPVIEPTLRALIGACLAFAKGLP